MRQRVFVTTLAGLFVLGALSLGATGVQGQTAPKPVTLGTVHIPRAVTANGEPLPAGTYQVRLTTETPQSVVGESPDSEVWVEFLQGGKVKGREIATVVQKADVKEVAKTAPPAAGADRVELLKGNDYLRVWVNHGGTQYLVHLVVK